MEQLNRYKFACFVLSLCAIAFSAPLFAEATGQSKNMACDATMMSGAIEQISDTHATLTTSILIDASVVDVWTTLTDFDAMSDWSTGTLQGMSGNIQNGGRVMITFLFGVDENGEPIANEIPHTLIYEEGKKFGWSDPFPVDNGGGHDNHIYHVQPCGTRTLFVQSDEIVDNPYAANFVAQLLPMYQLFNTELKSAVEKR